MTKKEAAAHVLYVTNLMGEALAGDEDADLWISLLEQVAYDLDAPTYSRLVEYREGPSRRVKLRRLIDHPETPQPERENALRALARLS